MHSLIRFFSSNHAVLAYLKSWPGTWPLKATVCHINYISTFVLSTQHMKHIRCSFWVPVVTPSVLWKEGVVIKDDFIIWSYVRRTLWALLFMVWLVKWWIWKYEGFAVLHCFKRAIHLHHHYISFHAAESRLCFLFTHYYSAAPLIYFLSASVFFVWAWIGRSALSTMLEWCFLKAERPCVLEMRSPC